MIIIGKSFSGTSHAFEKMCGIARTASNRRAVVIWPTTEEPYRITAVEPRISVVQTVELRLKKIVR